MLLVAVDAHRRRSTDEILRSIIAERAGPARRYQVDKDVPFNKIPTKGADHGRKGTEARYPTEDRIGVLEALDERYSVRAFLPREVPRGTIEHILKSRSAWRLVQQPALAGADRER
jgi:hypothetical protein